MKELKKIRELKASKITLPSNGFTIDPKYEFFSNSLIRRPSGQIGYNKEEEIIEKNDDSVKLVNRLEEYIQFYKKNHLWYNFFDGKPVPMVKLIHKLKASLEWGDILVHTREFIPIINKKEYINKVLFFDMNPYISLEMRSVILYSAIYYLIFKNATTKRRIRSKITKTEYYYLIKNVKEIKRILIYFNTFNSDIKAILDSDYDLFGNKIYEINYLINYVEKSKEFLSYKTKDFEGLPSIEIQILAQILISTKKYKKQ